MSQSTKTSKKSSPVKSRRSTLEPEDLEQPPPKTTFAIVKICAKVAITEPPQDLNQLFNVTATKREIFKSCSIAAPPKLLRNITELEHEEAYRCFDDSVYQLVDSIIRNNGKTNKDTGYYYCSYASNIMNRILSLLACDFNRRVVTKTTVDFTVILNRNLVYSKKKNELINN